MGPLRQDMTMNRRHSLALVTIVSVLVLGCAAPAPAPPPPTAAPPAQGHMNMLQLMRAFPFPHANVLFDTQSRDPEGAEKKASMAFSVYRWGESDTYAGWPAVEASALALAEMAPILNTPRACENGKPAPVDREDWKKAVDGLATVGDEIGKIARTKNLAAMVDASEKLSNACAACHDIYRDVDLEGGVRCSVPAS
jgi:hypothetical protein